MEPKDYPPPFDERGLIAEPTDPEDERIEVGVAIVGGGPAGLACANRLLDLLADEPELMEKLGEVPVAVIEKGKVCGAHTLSGANMDPSAMQELFPDLDPADWPFAYQEVTKDAVYLLTKKAALPLKPMPPNFRNHGNYVISVSKLSRFLAEQAEEKGAYILTETVADKLLVEDRIVRGIRSGDRGRGKDGEPLGNFEPGSDVVAKTTVLAEGTLGHLTQGALDYFDLHGALPVRWELGVKEVWKVEKPLDRVIHTMGWPLRKRREVERVRRQLHLPDGRGQALHRDGDRPRLHRLDASPATTCCRSSRRTRSSRRCSRAASASRGAPRRSRRAATSRCRAASRVPGMAIAGDAANMVNVPTLKGVHYAMHAGMYAAEAIFEALKNDSVNLDAYDEKVRKSTDRRRTCSTRATCARRSRRASSSAARSPAR